MSSRAKGLPARQEKECLDDQINRASPILPASKIGSIVSDPIEWKLDLWYCIVKASLTPWSTPCEPGSTEVCCALLVLKNERVVESLSGLQGSSFSLLVYLEVHSLNLRKNRNILIFYRLSLLFHVGHWLFPQGGPTQKNPYSVSVNTVWWRIPINHRRGCHDNASTHGKR